jgi:hypothetical protein
LGYIARFFLKKDERKKSKEERKEGREKERRKKRKGKTDLFKVIESLLSVTYRINTE